LGSHDKKVIINGKCCQSRRSNTPDVELASGLSKMTFQSPHVSIGTKKSPRRSLEMETYYGEWDVFTIRVIFTLFTDVNSYFKSYIGARSYLWWWHSIKPLYSQHSATKILTRGDDGKQFQSDSHP